MKKLKNLKRKYKEWIPSKYVTVLLLIVPFLMFTIKDFKLDNDFWFLTNTGKYILNHGFTTIEPFTIHNGLFFIPQQLLTTIIFYFIYHNFGIIGILILELAINGLIIYLMYSLSKLISNNKKISILIATIVDSILIITGIITSRPQIFDIVLLLLLLILLEKYIKEGNYKYLLFIPLISILQINLHASTWLMLFVFLIPYYAEYIIKRIKKEKTFKIKPILVISIISFICGLINPYNINAMLYIFKSFGINEINMIVGEMKAATINKNIIIFIVIFINLILIYKNKGNNKIRYILLFLGTTYLMLSHIKGTLFFLITTILLLSSIKLKKEKYKEYKINTKEKGIYIIMIIFLLTFIVLNIRIDRYINLIDVANYLDKNTSSDIKLYTEYDYGDYLEYRGYKCYIDARAEVFLKSNNKKEDIFIEYYNMYNGKIRIDKFLDKYNFDYLVIFPSNYILLNELNRNDNYERIKYTNKKKKMPILYKRKN